MSAPQRSDTESRGPAPSRGVWGFMKRKVWGDVPSHPISDSGSESHRARSPETRDLDVSTSHDTTTPKAGTSPTEPRPHSPFQSHIQAHHEDDSDEDSHSDKSATVSSASNKMASEPSLRHGLGEGSHTKDTQPGDPMNRLPSLAAGISGSGFEWDLSPAKRPLPDPPTLNTDSNLTFSSSPPVDNSSNNRAQPERAEGSDIFASRHDLDEVRAEGMPHDAMTEKMEEGSNNSDVTNDEQDEGAQSMFSAMQTKAPGLTPLRLTPKTEPPKPRVANPPPPTSFPAGAVAAQGGLTPPELEQTEQQQNARHGADLTPSPRTGAIVDELLQGVVSENLATSESGGGSPEQEARPHGALQVGPAPSELEWLPHDAAQVEGLPDEQSGALRIPQPGREATPHGALPVEGMPRVAPINTKLPPLPDLPETPGSPRSATSGTTSSPRSPYRAAVDLAETAFGLTGGAVAGLMAGSALVGIGAAALTGGAVLNAMDFPRSPRKAATTGSAASDAQPAATDPAAGAPQGQQQHGDDATDSGARADTSSGRPTLERLSSGAKRQADSSWSQAKSPLKRQEFDQSSASQAAADESSDSAMTHASMSDTTSAADDKAREVDSTADSADSGMSHVSPSESASEGNITATEDAAASDTTMTDALASDTASAADDKAAGALAAEPSRGQTHASRPRNASMSGGSLTTHADDSNPAGSQTARADSAGDQRQSAETAATPSSEARSTGSDSGRLSSDSQTQGKAHAYQRAGADTDDAQAGSRGAGGAGPQASMAASASVNQAQSHSSRSADAEEDAFELKTFERQQPPSQAETPERSAGTADLPPGGTTSLSGAPELQQTSPAEEDLSTIAEEPAAERAASEAQPSQAQAGETHPHSVGPQQASDQGEVNASSGAQAITSEAAAGADSSRQSQGGLAHEPQDMDLDSRIDGADEGHSQQSLDQAEKHPTGRLPSYPGGSAEPQQPQAAASEASTTQSDGTVQPLLSFSVGKSAADDTEKGPSQPGRSSANTAPTPEEPHLGSSLGQQASDARDQGQSTQASSFEQGTGVSANTAAIPEEPRFSSSLGQQARHITEQGQSSQTSSRQQAVDMPGAPGEPSLQSTKGQAAATAQQHPSLDHKQEPASRVAESPALRSPAGQSAAGTTCRASPSHDEQTADDSGLEVPRLESAAAKEAAVESAAVEEAAAEASQGRQGSSRDEKYAKSEPPQEPVLCSGVGQQAASVAEGEQAERSGSQVAPNLHTASAADLQSTDGHTDSATTFPDDHQVSNTAPGGEESMLAEPLTSDRQQSTLQRRTPATPSADQPVVEDPHSHGAQEFASHHHVRNAAPSSSESLFAAPLTSDSHDARSFEHGRQQVAQGSDSTPVVSESDAASQDFASQHHVSNQTPPAEHAYAQPLTSDQQRHDSEQAEAGSSTQDFASQHHVRNAAPAEDHAYTQPLTSDQQRHQLDDSEQPGPDASTQDFASQHAVQNSAPGDERSYAQPLTSDEPQSQQLGTEQGTHTQDLVPERQATSDLLHEEHAQPLTSDRHRHQSGSEQHHPESSVQGLTSQPNLAENQPAEESLYAQPFEQHQQQPQTGSQTDSHSRSVLGQQDFAAQHSVHNEPPAEESLYSRALTSNQHGDGADFFPADTARSSDAASSTEQEFASQHSVHNEPPSAETGHDQPVTSEHQRPGTHSSQRPISRSGDQTTSGDLRSAPTPSLGEGTRSSEQTGHSQARGSEQEVYASRQSIADEDVDTDMPAGKPHGTAAQRLPSSQQPQEQQPSLTGRLLNTLFGGGGSAADHRSQGQDAPQGRDRQLQADTKGQQRAGLERQQPGSAYPARVDAPEGAVHSQQAAQEQGMSLRPRQDPTTRQQQQQQQQQPVVPEGQTVKEPSLPEYSSMAETETALATAQRAQREALQAEGDSLQTSLNSLAELKGAMQTEQGGPMQEGDPPPAHNTLQPDTKHKHSSDLPQNNDVDQEAAQSMRETNEVLKGAQQSQREALQAGQQLLQSEREDVQEVQRAVQHQHRRGRSQGDSLEREQQDNGDDYSRAETEAALAAAQQAQKRALHVEQEVLAEEHESLMQLREVMQQQSGKFASGGSRPDAESRNVEADERLQDASMTEGGTDLMRARQAEREGMQAIQESMQSNQEGLMEARQGIEHQQGAAAKADSAVSAGESEDDESLAETHAALAEARQAGREPMPVRQNSLSDSHKRLLNAREAMQHPGQDSIGEAVYESAPHSGMQDSSELHPPSGQAHPTRYPQPAASAEPAASYHQPLDQPHDRPFDQPLDQPHNRTFDQPHDRPADQPHDWHQDRDTSYPQAPEEQASRQQAQPEEVTYGRAHTEEPSYDHPYPGQDRPEQPYAQQATGRRSSDWQPSYEEQSSVAGGSQSHSQMPIHDQNLAEDQWDSRGHVGQSSQGQGQLYTPQASHHQIQADRGLSSEQPFTRASGQQQPFTAPAGYDDSDIRDSGYEQAYSQGGGRGNPDAPAWGGGSDSAGSLNRQQGTAPIPEAAEQQPSWQRGFSGSYSVSRHTESSNDSGTWFQTPRWHPAPQDEAVTPMYQQAQPQYGRDEQLYPQYGQHESQYQQPELYQGGYAHAPLRGQSQSDHPEPRHQQDQLHHEQSAPAPSEYHEQTQQRDPQRDYAHPEYQQGQASYERKPSHDYQAEPQHGYSQHAQPQDEQGLPEYGQDESRQPQYQQAEQQHDQYEQMPSHYQRAQPQHDHDQYEQMPSHYQHAQPQHMHNGQALSQRQQELLLPRLREHSQPQGLQGQRQSAQQQGLQPQHGQAEPQHEQHGEAFSHAQRAPSAQHRLASESQPEASRYHQHEQLSQHDSHPHQHEQNMLRQSQPQHEERESAQYPDAVSQSMDLHRSQYGQHSLYEQPASKHMPYEPMQSQAQPVGPEGEAHKRSSSQQAGAGSQRDYTEAQPSWQQQNMPQPEQQQHLEDTVLPPGQHTKLQHGQHEHMPSQHQQAEQAKQHNRQVLQHEQAESHPWQQQQPLPLGAGGRGSGLSDELAQDREERATAQGETLSVTHNDDEPNDYTAGTETALAAAQQAQQQAMHVEQEALAEERQSLMQLREVMQQQPEEEEQPNVAPSQQGADFIGGPAASAHQGIATAAQHNVQDLPALGNAKAAEAGVTDSSSTGPRLTTAAGDSPSADVAQDESSISQGQRPLQPQQAASQSSGSVSEGVQEANDAVSEAGTGDDSAAATEAALMQAQQDQREAMLVSQNSLRDSRKQLLEVQETLQRQAEESHGNSSKLASGSAAQAAPQLEAGQGPFLPTEPADLHSDLTTRDRATPVLHPASQPEEHQLSMEDGSQDAVQRLAPAVAKPAGASDPVPSGGGYSSVPPSSLWGPPKQTPTASSSSVSAMERQPAQAGSGLNQAAGSDVAVADPGSAVVDPDLAVADPDLAAAQEGASGGNADMSAAGGEGLESPGVAQTGYGWGSNRPASHVNFARGNMGAKPARLRPALPQHWLQAVDERAADSSTLASTRSLPDPPDVPDATPNTADAASPPKAVDDQAGPTGVVSQQAGTDRRTDRFPLREQAGSVSASSGKAEPEASQTEMLQHGTSSADRSDPETEGQGMPPPEHPAAAGEEPSLLAAAEQLPAGNTASHGRDATDRDQGTHAGQTAGRDAVGVQQAAARDGQAWQHAGLAGIAAPLTYEAGTASPPQLVPKAKQPLTTAPEAEQTLSEVPEAEKALTPSPQTAEAALDLVPVEEQQADEGPKRAAHAADLNGGRPQGALPVPADIPAADSSEGLSQPSREGPVTQSAQGSSRQASERHAPSFAAQSGSRTIPGASDAESPSADDYQIPQSAGTSEGRSALHDQQGQGSKAIPDFSAPKSAAMLSLEAMIPPPFEFGSPSNSPTFGANVQAPGPAYPDVAARQANPTVPLHSPFQTSGSSAVRSPAPDQSGISHPAPADDSSISAMFDSRPQQPPAHPLMGELSHEPLIKGTAGARLTRLNSPEVQRRIEQTAEDVQQAVNEWGEAQASGAGAGLDERGRTSSDALARATGTLRALVAGHLEEAESLSQSLPTHSGTTENYPSERQEAVMRSVEGTTEAAKEASLERGVQAAFVFATADRAAAMLKALAIGKPLDKMESVPEATLEEVPSADRLHDMGFGLQQHQTPPHQEPSEASYVPEGSEASFMSAASHAAPAASVVSDVEFASLVDDAVLAEEQEPYLHAQGDAGLMTRVSSFPHGGVDHPASPLPPPLMSNLRSTPFDWGSSPASSPTHVPAATPSSDPALLPTSTAPSDRYTEQHQTHVPEAGAAANASIGSTYYSPASEAAATRHWQASTSPQDPSAVPENAGPRLGPRDRSTTGPVEAFGAASRAEPPMTHTEVYGPTAGRGAVPVPASQNLVYAGLESVQGAGLQESATAAAATGMTASRQAGSPTAAGPGSLGSQSQNAKQTSVDEADIENVNPQTVAAKQGHPAAFPAGSDLSAPAAAPAVHAAPDHALSESPPLSGSTEGPQAAALEAAPAAASKPFVSSKVLSEALFGTGDSSTATAFSAIKSPTSPFAEASEVSPAPAAGASVKAGAGKRPGTITSTTLDEKVSSGVQRPDGTPRDSGNVERIEEALMSSASPFSRRLSSDEVKPVLARLSQPGSARIKEEEQPGVQDQLAGGSTGRPKGIEGPQAAVTKQAAFDETQPAGAVSTGAPAPQTASVPTATSAAGNGPAATRVVQEDDSKARFVCCGFGGKKAGSKVQR